MGFTLRSTMHRTSSMCALYTIVLYFSFGVSFSLACTSFVLAAYTLSCDCMRR
jgi:hypothetical protein